MTSDGSPDEIIECSSPPCMLEEVYARTATLSVPLPRGDVPQTWAEVRHWRSAKRKILLQRRMALPAVDRASHHTIVSTILGQLLQKNEGKLVGFYWPFRGEYDPRPFVRMLQAKGMRFALPVVIGKAEPMIFREWKPGARMSQGVWNIPVPAEGNPVFPDLLLVPLVGFDKHRFRLGYGGGYYDRTIAAAPLRPRSIGIGYDGLELPTIHPQPHDIQMDCVVTERGIAYGSGA